MSYVAPIIDAFGGVRKTASEINMSPSAVQGWKKRGTIPDDQKPKVLEAAQRLGLALTRDDFWPVRAEAAA